MPDDSTSLLHLIVKPACLDQLSRLAQTANELNASLVSNDGKLEIGFVAGMILFQKQQWDAATQVYSEIAQRDPDFPKFTPDLAEPTTIPAIRNKL
jgi:hypothetical protein